MIKLRNLLMEIYIDGFTISDEKGGFRCPENFDSYEEGKGWIAYRGGNDWENGPTACAVYFNSRNESLARIWFNVKFPKGISPDADSPTKNQKSAKEWGEKASKKWITITRKIHAEPKDHFQDGTPWYKDWKDCFLEALKHKDMKQYVDEWGVDHTKWAAMKPSSED